MSLDLPNETPTANPELAMGESPPAEPAATRPGARWRQPWVIVVIVLGTLALGAIAVGAVAFIAYSASAPNELRYYKDYTTSQDVEFTVEPGLSWDESGGTLNLYPTDSAPQYLNFDIPTSDAAKVVATVTQPNFDVERSWLGWGVAVSNVGSGSGVMLVCEPGGPMSVIDLESLETLSNANGRCTETMEMSLSVNGYLIEAETDTGTQLMYSGVIKYEDLDTVSLVIAAEAPDQVLRVSEIAAYTP